MKSIEKNNKTTTKTKMIPLPRYKKLPHAQTYMKITMAYRGPAIQGALLLGRGGGNP